MKKALLKIVSILLLPSIIFAEDTLIKDSTYDVAWFDTLNEHFVVKHDITNEVRVLTGLTEDHCNWKASNSSAATNEVVVDNGKLRITHERLSQDNNWTDISLQFVGWFGGTGIKFGENADTVGGMFVNMEEEAIVTAYISSNVECDLRCDLMDINGHIASSGTKRNTIEPGALRAYEFDFDEELWDWYMGDFWGVSNGRYAPSYLTVGNQTITYDSHDYIPFDVSKVAKIMWGINDADQGTIGEPVIVEISNIILGDVNEWDPTSFINANDTVNMTFNPSNVIKAYYSYRGSIVTCNMEEGQTVPVDTTTPQTPTIDPSTVREVKTTYSENEVAEIVELIKESTSDSLYLTIAEQILEDLLGIDINTIVEDSLVIWYYYGDSQLKTDNTWQVYGYGPQMPVSADGQYQAKYMDQNGNVVGVSAIYQIGESPEPTVSVEETKALEISITNKTVSANQSGAFALTTLDGSVIATSTSNVVEIPSELSGVVLIQFTNKNGEVSISKAFVK